MKDRQTDRIFSLVIKTKVVQNVIRMSESQCVSMSPCIYHTVHYDLVFSPLSQGTVYMASGVRGSGGSRGLRGSNSRGRIDGWTKGR